jgi:hypothetical protein
MKHLPGAISMDNRRWENGSASKGRTGWRSWAWRKTYGRAVFGARSPQRCMLMQRR